MDKKDQTVKPAKQPISRRKLLASMGATTMGLAGMTWLGSKWEGLETDSGLNMLESTRSVSKAIAGNGKVFNVRDYGALGDGITDDSDAFQQAVNEIAAKGKGVLYIPAGNYCFQKKVTANVARWDFSMVGEGQGVSNLISQNADGVFKFTYTIKTSQMTVSDISFFADGQGKGTALDISQPEGGNRHHRNLVVQNVEMRGLDIEKDYFDYGIRAFAQWRALFWNVIFAGPYAGGVNRDQSEDSLLYKANCGILADGCYSPAFQNCYIWSAKKGVSILSDQNPGPEGSNFYNCFIVECRTGIDINAGGIEPGLIVDRCHVNCRDVGMRIRRKYFSITNCLLYNSIKNSSPENAMPYTDIELTDAVGGIITDTVFHQPQNKNRIMVNMKGRCSDIQVKDNYFNAYGRAVRINALSSNVIVSDNQFTDNVDKLVDDASPNLIFETHEMRRIVLQQQASQSIPPSTWTNISWDDAQTVPHGLIMENGKVVVPDNLGIHAVRLTANISWEQNDKGFRMVEFSKNGDSSFVGNGHASQTFETMGEKVEIPNSQHIQSAIIPVQAGDALFVRVLHTSNKEIRVLHNQSWFMVEVVSGTK